MNAFDRRRAVIGATGIALGAIATARLLPEDMLLRDRRPPRSRVAIISALQYSEALVDSVIRAIRLFNSISAENQYC
jgi:hypothetical protein